MESRDTDLTPLVFIENCKNSVPAGMPSLPTDALRLPQSFKPLTIPATFHMRVCTACRFALSGVCLIVYKNLFPLIFARLRSVSIKAAVVTFFSLISIQSVPFTALIQHGVNFVLAFPVYLQYAYSTLLPV